MIKTIQTVANDEISIKTLNLFYQNSLSLKGEGNSKISTKCNRNWNEEVCLSHLNYLIL